ncbi:MAG: hypothetical protein E7Z86_00170 [Methanosphaera stadtmanae]|jgi:hypothetical protein|nr:hypothetical protein [Methanosphaera stadtmanae]
MTNVIEDNLESIELLDIQQYQNMTVIGLNTPNTRPPDLMPLDVGLSMGLVEITEVDENGSVGQLNVINNAVTPLLLMDGEEIKGAKQNRIINATMIIPAKSQQIIDVSCSESGRWNYNSQTFKHSYHMASSKVRRSKQESVNNSLRTSNQRISNQSQVWDDIESTQASLNIESSTHAQQDTFISLEKDIDNYLKHFPLQQKQNASIIIINNQVIGMELLYNADKYSQYHQRYMESYIIDAITQQDEHADDNVDAAKLSEEFINRIRLSKIEEYQENNTNDYRLEDDQITGSFIFYEDNLVNASILRKHELTHI